MTSVRIFRVQGRMLLSHDSMPQWRKFTIDVRAVKREDALEKVYSELGSRHKLKRMHIRIERIEEVDPEKTVSKYAREIESIEGWVK